MGLILINNSVRKLIAEELFKEIFNIKNIAQLPVIEMFDSPTRSIERVLITPHSCQC